MKSKKSHVHSIGHWRKNLTPEEKKRLYLESISAQVHASMDFEGEHVDIETLKQYLKTLKDLP